MYSTDRRVTITAIDYEDVNRGLIKGPVVQINDPNFGVIGIVGREATAVGEDTMSFSEVRIISSTLMGKAKRGYVNSKTNEIILLDRPKFKIYRF
jgi:hypothetical protein